MPTAPYAKVLVSVEGGANQSGGIDVAAGATITLTGESTVGWRQQRWEIYDYPESFATPTGWTLADDGTIYSTAVAPAAFDLDADLWGPYGIRLTVNGAIDSDPTIQAGLVDATTALMVLSPKGQRAVMALEGGQFCTSTTLLKQWVRTLQRNLIAIEEALAVSELPGDADGTLTVTADEVVNTSDAKFQPRSLRGHVTTADDTLTTVTLMATPADHEVYGINGVVLARDAAGHGAVVGMWRIASVLHTDGFLNADMTPSGSATDASPILSAGAAGMTATMSAGATGVRLKVQGLADTAITWGWELYAGKLDA